MKTTINYRGFNLNKRLKNNLTRKLKKLDLELTDNPIKFDIYVLNQVYPKFNIEVTVWEYEDIDKNGFSKGWIKNIIIWELKRKETTTSFGTVLKETVLIS